MIFVLMTCRMGLSFYLARETIQVIVSVSYLSVVWSASRVKPSKGVPSAPKNAIVLAERKKMFSFFVCLLYLSKILLTLQMTLSYLFHTVGQPSMSLSRNVLNVMLSIIHTKNLWTAHDVP